MKVTHPDQPNINDCDAHTKQKGRFRGPWYLHYKYMILLIFYGSTRCDDLQRLDHFFINKNTFPAPPLALAVGTL